MTPRLFWSLAFALPIPLLAMYFYSLWLIEQYQFFIVLILAIGTMLYGRWDRLWHFPTKWPVRITILLGLLSILTGCFLLSPWLGYFGFLLLFSSFCISHFEKPQKEGHEPISRGTLFYLSLAPWLCLRVPLNLDQQLTLGLQHLTAKMSSYCLDLLAIPHQLSGVIFDMADGKLFVEEACSGVQSLFSLLCVALLFLAWNRRPIVLAPIYIAAAIFSAGLLNIARVVSIAVTQDWYQLDLAHGWKHDVLGYTCLTAAILLLGSFDRLFQVFFYPISDDTNPLGKQRIPNPLKLIWNRFLSPVADNSIGVSPVTNSGLLAKSWFSIVPIGFIAIGWGATAIFATQYALRDRTPTAEPRVGGENSFWIPNRQLFAGEKDLLIEGFEQSRDGLDISKGQNADIWNIYDASKRMRHRVAISQPYDGFHDLCICYEGNGWRKDSRKVITLAPTGESIADWPYIYSSWFNDNGSYAYLTFSSLDTEANPVLPPDETVSDIFRNRFSLGGGNKSSVRECLMFQVWTTLDSPLDTDAQKELEQFHLRLREIVRASFKNQIAKSNSP
jgi:exosortase